MLYPREGGGPAAMTPVVKRCPPSSPAGVWAPACAGVDWHERAEPHRCATTTGALGTCARIDGEYIASTRVGGRLNRPAPFSRMV